MRCTLKTPVRALGGTTHCLAPTRSACAGRCWPVLAAYVRIGTNRRVFDKPLSIAQAVNRVESWLDQPCTRVVRATERHWEVFRSLLVEGQATANLATDAHLAALAMEHGCRVASTDADFSRFPGLNWYNPLRE